MDKKISILDWWCDRAWIKFGCWISAIMTSLILLFWRKWSTELKITASIAALIPIHVLEEWVFPGGFNYQYNLFLYKSDQPDRYPMSRLSDMITNLEATFGYVVITIIYAIIEDKGGYIPTGFIMGTIVFSFLEVIVHTSFGIMAYFHFKKEGKTTIYGPGSITAYSGFGVFGFILVYSLIDRINEKLLFWYDWAIMSGELSFILVCCILVPENIIKKKDSKYFFKNNGYFDRFLDGKLKNN